MPTALILGATSDIGVAIAVQFAKNGYALQLAGRNVAQLQIIAADLQIRCEVACTVYEFDALAFDKHAAFYTSLAVKPDITICVMGYMQENEQAIKQLDETLRTIHTNYTGTVSILNIIAADYALRRAGVIVGISSVAGERGRQSNYIYGSAKAAFTAYLSGLRNKLFHYGVHVMTVLPGFVNTRMTEHLSLPKVLTAQPHEVAAEIYTGIKKRRNVIYVKWFWRWIMLLIKLIPEPVFKSKKL